jgi:hypothetical protein
MDQADLSRRRGEMAKAAYRSVLPANALSSLPLTGPAAAIGFAAIGLANG